MERIQTRLAIVAWLAAALCHLVETLHRTFPAAAFVGMAEDLGADAAAMGLIGSAYFFIYMFMQVPGGLLGDKYGPVPVLTVGTVVAGIGSLVVAGSQSIVQAFSGRFLVGLGVAVVFVNVLALQAELFSPAIFATLSGWVAFLGNIGSVVGMAPLAQLCDQVGWRRAAQILALFSVVVAAVAWVAGRSFNRPKEKATTQNIRCQAGTLLTTSGVKAVLLSYFCTCGPLMAIVTLWGIPYIMTIWEVSSAQAAASLGLVPLATMISAPLLGTLADKLGKKRPLLLFCYALQTAALVALLILSPTKADYWVVSLCCFLLGIPNSMYVL
ncbi:MAG: MFS transporter, partial [Firmicutes bacterium]|nr:MFS transporter [Bacillota bacterium]